VRWIELALGALVKYIRGHQLQSTGGPHMCLHVSKVGEVGIESTRILIFSKAMFVLLLFIKVAISSCRLVILRLLNCTVETIRVTKGCRYFP
jgi:hypothetical protein